MAGKRDRNENASNTITAAACATKKLKNSETEDEHPKSRKELRAERKLAAKLAKDAAENNNQDPKRLSKEEYKKQKQELRKKERQQIRKQEMKLQRKLKKERKQKKPEKKGPSSQSLQQTNPTDNLESRLPDEEVNNKILDELINGKSDETSGMTTLSMGIQYQDILVGKGPTNVQSKNLVTVKYRLTGGKFGGLIDSSNSFTFRVGKGEVIQGWDIGVQGMREGGRRKLIVPPKAGYGSQDIGAGPGATLFFDITLLKIVR